MPLCKQCSELDFSEYRLRKRPQEINFTIDIKNRRYWIDGASNEYDIGDDGKPLTEDPTFGEEGQKSDNIPGLSVLEQGSMRQQIMIASDIIRRKETCELCNVMTHHIFKNRVGPDASIKIFTEQFCDTIDIKHKRRDTVRLKVYEMKETPDTISGPLEAYQIAVSGEKESRCILELQECSTPPPTIDDEHLQTRKRLSRATDTRFSGRLVNSKANLGLFSKWIKLCDKLHGEDCRQPIFPMNVMQGLNSLLVIDVDRMCIIDAPANCRYVALSYCWGTAIMLKHVLGNSAALRKDGALLNSSAPATISDAIELVRGVGERYLWVDALCIVQDDPAVQKAQLAQMGLIYSLAAFTIVATSGNDANAGLPGVRTDTRNIDQSLVQVGEKILLTVVDGQGYYGGLKKSSWVTRAWTMQEKILSKKLLIFTDQQVYWNCWNTLWLEEVALEDVFNIDFHHPPLRTGPADVGFSSINESRDIWGLYKLLVNAYRERQMTFKSDILNAFSGICQAMTAIENESFHWGLPVSRFDASLCWYLRGGGTRNRGFCDPDKDGSAVLSVPFPSWSWAAWHGTSGHSWISWQYELDVRQNPPDIIFFGYDIEGRLNQISQSLSSQVGLEEQVPKDRQSEEPMDSTNQWKGQPQIIHEAPCKAPINTGLLYFWTSTATLTVRREFDPLGSTYKIVNFGPDHRLLIDTTAHLQFTDVGVKSKLSEGIIMEPVEGIIIEPVEGVEGDGVVSMDFVVVSTYGRSTLYALAVEWENDIAYRIGVAFFHVSDWVKSRKSAWNRVVLVPRYMIYAHATKTLIWLGEETPEVKNAIPALKLFQKTSGHTSLADHVFKNDHAPDIHGLHDRFYELCGDKKAETIAQLANFFQRPWFSRKWIIQEVVNSKDPRVILGHQKIKWGAVEDFAVYFIRYRAAFYLPIDEIRLTTSHLSNVAGLAILKARKMSLAHLIHMGIRFMCKEASDQVISVLGLDSNLNREDKRLLSGYSVSPLELFRRFTRRTIELEPHLDILSMVNEVPLHDRSPSWVSDFTKVTLRGPAGMAISFRNIHPTRDLTVSASFSENGRLLSLTGRIVDIIDSLGTSTKANTGVWAAESMVTDRAFGENRMYEECEEIAMVDMRSEAGLTTQQDLFYGFQWYKNYMRQLARGEMSFDESGLAEHREVMTRIGWRETGTGYHLFTRTRSGRLGWVCPYAQQNDLVCIFNGAKSYHVMRSSSTDKGRYRLIRDCYMQGLMEGEVMDISNLHKKCLILE